MDFFTKSGQIINNNEAYAKTGAPMFDKNGKNVNNETTIYCIDLKGGRKYIGKTKDIDKRMHQHFNGNGSQVTKKNQPIDYEILETSHGYFSSKKEQEHTDKMIGKYGYTNVRGGKYTNSNTMSINGSCYRCGRDSHYVSNCYAKTHINGKII